MCGGACQAARGAYNIRASRTTVSASTPAGHVPLGFRHELGVWLMARVASRRFKQLRDEFFAEGRRLDADPATRDQSVCWLCGQRIDYDAAPGTTDDSHELDHVVPVSVDSSLQEDPTNFAHAHRRCNGRRGGAMPSGGLGDLVPDWW